MSTITVNPNGDGSIGSWVTDTGGTTNLYQKVNDVSDSTYVTEPAGVSSATNLFLLMEDMPADFGTPTAISIAIRANKSGSGATGITAALYQSDESTAITGTATTTNLPLIVTDYTLNPTITGALTVGVWNGARIKLFRSNSTSPDVFIYKVSVTITYTPNTGLPPGWPQSSPSKTVILQAVHRSSRW